MPSPGYDLDRICRWVALMPLLPPAQPRSLAHVADQVGGLPPWLERLLLVSDGLVTSRGLLLTARRILDETQGLRSRRIEDEQLWAIVVADLVPFFQETEGSLLAYHHGDLGIYRIRKDEAFLAHVDWTDWFATELRRALALHLQRRLSGPSAPAKVLEESLKGFDLAELAEVGHWVRETAVVTLECVSRELGALRGRRRGSRGVAPRRPATGS